MVFIYVVSILVAILAAISDIKSRRITNRFILKSYIAGAVLRILFSLKSANTDCMVDGLTGMIVPYLVLIIFYIFKIIGGADIKLISALGLIIGIRRVCILIISSFVFAGLIGVVEVTIFKRERGYMIPFAVPIMMGLFYVMVKDFLNERIINYM